MDHNNVDISTKFPRQKLSIAVFEPACWDPSPEGLDWPVLSIKQRRNQKKELAAAIQTKTGNVKYSFAHGRRGGLIWNCTREGGDLFGIAQQSRVQAVDPPSHDRTQMSYYKLESGIVPKSPNGTTHTTEHQERN